MAQPVEGPLWHNAAIGRCIRLPDNISIVMRVIRVIWLLVIMVIRVIRVLRIIRVIRVIRIISVITAPVCVIDASEKVRVQGKYGPNEGSMRGL